MGQIWIPILAVLWLAALSAQGQALELRTAAQDSAPKFYLDAKSKQTRGLCIDILRAITEIDPSLSFSGQDHFLPSARIYRALREGSLDLFCGSGKTPVREQQIIYLSPPLYSVNHRLLARVDDPVDVDSFEALKALGEAGMVLTYLNSATHHYLQEVGELEMEEGSDLDNLFERLRLGRGRFIYYHDLGLYHYVRTHGLTSEVRFLPTKFRSYSHYLVVSRQAPKSTVIRLQEALERLAASGKLEAIYRDYAPR